MDFLNRQGPEAVRHILDAHGLAPGAYRFPVKLTDEVTDAEFMESARAFEEECPRAIAAGYKTCAMHLLPWSETDLSFGEHFRLCQRRLAHLAPIIRDNDVRVGR